MARPSAAMCRRSALRQGIEEFNRGAFLEQHETPELEWIDEADWVRYLYQASCWWAWAASSCDAGTLAFGAALEAGIGYLDRSAAARGWTWTA